LKDRIKHAPSPEEALKLLEAVVPDMAPPTEDEILAEK
jgi:hypothetical protein